MKLRNILPIALLALSCAEVPPLPPMVDIPAASFRMSATEITNAQYEAFDPSHRDGMIHLLSSRVHYRFNLAWIQAR